MGRIEILHLYPNNKYTKTYGKIPVNWTNYIFTRNGMSNQAFSVIQSPVFVKGRSRKLKSFEELEEQMPVKPGFDERRQMMISEADNAYPLTFLPLFDDNDRAAHGEVIEEEIQQYAQNAASKHDLGQSTMQIASFVFVGVFALASVLLGIMGFDRFYGEGADETPVAVERGVQ